MAEQAGTRGVVKPGEPRSGVGLIVALDLLAILFGAESREGFVDPRVVRRSGLR